MNIIKQFIESRRFNWTLIILAILFLPIGLVWYSEYANTSGTTHSEQMDMIFDLGIIVIPMIVIMINIFILYPANRD